jgi:hypothetical protein
MQPATGCPADTNLRDFVLLHPVAPAEWQMIPRSPT